MFNATPWWKRGRLLGSGASGHVYEAHVLQNSDFPSLMAVKSSHTYGLIKREKQILSLLRGHPHIIHLYLYNVTVERGIFVYNIFLEYASGGNLLDQVDIYGGGLSEFVVSGYVKGVLEGLDAIHELGYVHCDIKPENILIVDGVAKIADFGMTVKTGVLRNIQGTVEFVAPEIIRYKNYTSKADIWSLGLTILMALTGTCLWDPKLENLQLLNLIGFSNQMPVIPKGLSINAIDFLSKCLVKNYELRWTAKMLMNHPFVKVDHIIDIGHINDIDIGHHIIDIDIGV